MADGILFFRSWPGGPPTLGEWVSAEGAIAASCARSGLSDAAAASRAAMAVACARRLLGAGVPPSSAARAFHVPGRVELFGKHTDYAGGRSLLGAIERGFIVLACARADALVRVHRVGADADADWRGPPSAASAASAAHSAADVAEASLAEEMRISDQDDWALYPLTAVRRIARNFGACAELSTGADLALACDLPPASGLSSSSALITATPSKAGLRVGARPPATARAWRAHGAAPLSKFYVVGRQPVEDAFDGPMWPVRVPGVPRGAKNEGNACYTTSLCNRSSP
ncbi:hypothetical protein KFE25_002780 [Diacronema lutheri]|uniref:Galactokinase n=1 Tax=Diacronema lutheri TaxID=2081491 RepID=A0A8J6CFB7_DIALT|nr:hypothetical protein KFE25_002780 [Diacronema lutheri]